MTDPGEALLLYMPVGSGWVLEWQTGHLLQSDKPNCKLDPALHPISPAAAPDLLYLVLWLKLKRCSRKNWSREQ